MTKREALEHTIIIWDWLADNPGKNKWDCPLVNKKWPYGCPCCEYVYFTTNLTPGVNCHKPDSETLGYCPLKNFWPKGCDDDSSPYNKWGEMTVRLQEETPDNDEADKCSKYAKEIADAARAELANLKD